MQVIGFATGGQPPVQKPVRLDSNKGLQVLAVKVSQGLVVASFIWSETPSSQVAMMGYSVIAVYAATSDGQKWRNNR